MSDWSLPRLLSGLHDDIEQRLKISRENFGHPGTKGDATERVWLDMLQTYLPKRYQAAKAHVVDSQGAFSDQIDVVIFDRQYSPFIFQYNDQTIIPAESVYAVFEAKQAINAAEINYAAQKVASVRRLHRTSLPITYARGVYPPKDLIPIIGGILTFESDWSPPLGEAALAALGKTNAASVLNVGCVAAAGMFERTVDGAYEIRMGRKPATSFLFKLISMLQFNGTVPMIDVQAYAEWLAD